MIDSHQQAFEQMFEAAPVGLAVIGPDSRIVRTNSALDSLFRSEEGALVGWTLTRLFNGEQIPADGRFAELALGPDGVCAKVALTPLASGETLLTAYEAAPDLAQSSQRLSLALDAAGMGDWSWRANDDVVDLSPRAAEIFGLEEREITWTTMRNLLHPDDRERARIAVEEAIADQSDYNIEYRVLLPGGGERWVAARGRGMYLEGDPVGMLGVVADVTDRYRREEALREKELHYKAAAEASFDSFFILSAVRSAKGLIEDFEFVDLNERGATLIGIPRDKALGGKLLELLPMNKDLGFFDKYVRVVETREPLLEEFGECGAGHVGVWIRQQTVPLGDGIAITASDATERKREEQALRDSESRLRLALEAGRMGTWEWDMATNHVKWSESLERMHDMEPGTFPGNFAAVIEDVHPEDRERVAAQIARTVEDRKDHCVEYRLQLRDGTIRWVEGRGKLILDLEGQPARMVGVCTDITDRKRHEEEIRLLNAALEQRVEERTAELQAAYREMEGFTYSVSHDLRAPLRAMMAATRILIEDHGSKLSDEAKGELDRLGTAAGKMGDLVDDLLQFSRLGRAQIMKREVDLSGMLADLVATCQERYETAVAAEIEPDLMAEADPPLLRLALENLVDNAFKYRRSDGEARLEFGRSEEGFYVRDNGIGFEPQYGHKLFLPFERLHLDNEYPGTGIGLANVRRIVEKHGGKIWAHSDGPGSGATFWFTL